jgi:hypothetical protein
VKPCRCGPIKCGACCQHEIRDCESCWERQEGNGTGSIPTWVESARPAGENPSLVVTSAPPAASQGAGTFLLDSAHNAAARRRRRGVENGAVGERFDTSEDA